MTERKIRIRKEMQTIITGSGMKAKYIFYSMIRSLEKTF